MIDTIQQLHELPDLAAEVFLTWGHPNPTDRPAYRTKRVHYPAPADLDALDCLRADEYGLLFRLAQCVRAVVEDLPAHPADIEATPTWTSESKWLIAHHADWRTDQFLSDLIGSEVAHIHLDLSRAARVQPPLRLVCTRAGCTDLVHLGPGGQFYRCEAGHIIDHHAEIKRLGQLVSMTYLELEEALGIPQPTLRQWAHRRRIRPDGRRAGSPTFNVEQVRRAIAWIGA